jgi:hypothetical protein
LLVGISKARVAHGSWEKKQGRARARVPLHI